MITLLRKFIQLHITIYWEGARVSHLHVRHHKRNKMVKANFNITSPIFDYLLGALFWQAIAEFEAQMSKLSKSPS